MSDTRMDMGLAIVYDLGMVRVRVQTCTAACTCALGVGLMGVAWYTVAFE